ncbi:glycosyltransferase [Actinacidiphila sp. ITFR-21]|uniref:glycosyltransferase n=1 Tax=Actinacidiphila sp. ITFR-21 TaxID=3075199 RepID=UPI00288AF738|nr:glycosyltransferase [Streptomyces sp. ITFR-21]WNI19029.1 glycosyltransferase [Streptomyces sp. ITFR-21]
MSVRAVAVVIPAHNEEALLPAALDGVALAARHPDLAGVRVLTVVVADSCRDRTADVAGRAGALVVAADCRNPGRARAAGTERALRELGAGGTWIAATDADSVVPPSWLAYHRARAREGWEAVVGTVTLPATTPVPLGARHRAHYEATRPADGAFWHHPHIHGANLGLTGDAYRAAGGFPPLGVGEDRALVDALERLGHRVLRTPDCPVVTSDRLRARARGGFADHLAALTEPPA